MFNSNSLLSQNSTNTHNDKKNYKLSTKKRSNVVNQYGLFTTFCVFAYAKLHANTDNRERATVKVTVKSNLHLENR